MLVENNGRKCDDYYRCIVSYQTCMKIIYVTTFIIPLKRIRVPVNGVVRSECVARKVNQQLDVVDLLVEMTNGCVPTRLHLQ